jgi:ATP-binding cassette subfamily F protein uup
MPLLQLSSVSLAYGHVPLLDRVELVIEPGERLGLIGRNGTGKSSLLSVIDGSSLPDDGKVWRAPGLEIARVPQEPLFTPGLSVFDAVAEGLGKNKDLLVQYHAATHDAGNHDDAWLERLHALQERLESGGGWNLQHRIEATLGRL